MTNKLKVERVCNRPQNQPTKHRVSTSPASEPVSRLSITAGTCYH